MKILYINYLFINDGSHVHVNSFVRAMQKIGVEIDCLWQNRKKTITRDLKWRAISSKSSNLKSIKSCFYELKSLAVNIRYFVVELLAVWRHKYDALVVRYSLNAFSAILVGKIARIPVILEVNSPLYYERKIISGKKNLSKLSQRIEKWILRNATRVVAVSRELKEFFVSQGIEKDSIVCIRNGVDTNRFFPREKDPNLLRKLNITPDTFVLGFSGSFQKWHGVMNALEIVEQLRTHVVSRKICLLFVGDGLMRDEVEQQAKQKGFSNVIFSGRVPHAKMPEYLALFDVALAPYPEISNFYFSPLKVFEYMAMGIPTIASHQGQLAEIIKDRETGILVPPGKAELFTKAVLEVFENVELSNHIGNQAAEIVENYMTWEATATSYHALIAEVLDSCG